jgi:hypothetical protein
MAVLIIQLLIERNNSFIKKSQVRNWHPFQKESCENCGNNNNNNDNNVNNYVLIENQDLFNSNNNNNNNNKNDIINKE